jgi:uncharacterized protein YndB with AHSA1/START domain
MNKPSFVYVTYISTTPEKVWHALVDSELTKQYWARHRNVSDWKVGSSWKHVDYDDANIVDIVGKVVESNPPNRLVLTWAHPQDEALADKNSRVTFEIDPMSDGVRLTVTHEDLEPDSKMLHGIKMGWPAILSSLKTLLETEKPLALTSRRWSGDLK